MGRMRSMGAEGPENTVISYRMAREVARELRGRGWAVTARACQGLTSKQLAKRVMLGTARGSPAEDRLAGEIAGMCGLVPAMSEDEGATE